MTFDHVGLFVREIAQGKRAMQSMVQTIEWGPVIDDPGMRISACFGTDATGLRYELVAPFGTPNPVSGLLSSGRNLLNHLAYRVPDIETASRTLRKSGALPIGKPQPAVAFGGARVMFFMSPLRFVVEIIETQAAPGRPAA